MTLVTLLSFFIYSFFRVILLFDNVLIPQATDLVTPRNEDDVTVAEDKLALTNARLQRMPRRFADTRITISCYI